MYQNWFELVCNTKTTRRSLTINELLNIIMAALNGNLNHMKIRGIKSSLPMSEMDICSRKETEIKHEPAYITKCDRYTWSSNGAGCSRLSDDANSSTFTVSYSWQDISCKERYGYLKTICYCIHQNYTWNNDTSYIVSNVSNWN